MPYKPYDAKGLMVAAIRDKNPVVFIDDRWLYGCEGTVPQEIYEVPIGKGDICSPGKDLTIVSASYALLQCEKAVEKLAADGIRAELVDLRTIKPLDENLILQSVKKTGRLIVVDGGWRSFGVAAEIMALVAEKGFAGLKAPVRRITLPDVPAPASKTLEAQYYISVDEICRTAREII
jgi:pyruvate dehydrogenase E1 component beta subunit